MQIAVNCVYIPFLSILYVFSIQKHNIHIHNFALVVALYARLCVLLLLLLLSMLFVLFVILFCIKIHLMLAESLIAIANREKNGSNTKKKKKERKKMKEIWKMLIVSNTKNPEI